MKESLHDYLITNNAPSTAKRYLSEINLFLFSLEKKGVNPKLATYTHIMDYIGTLRGKYSNLSCQLHGVKKYYSYLISTGQRKDNPARYIRLRDKISRDIQLQDLFTTAELSLLMNRRERYVLLKNKNLIVLSLLIYQGLRSGDVTQLTLENINLEQGTVYIKQGRKTNARTLKLQAKQVFWLMNYLTNDRPKLLKSTSDNLIISNRGTAETGEGVSYLIATFKYLFPKRNLNPLTVRQSVITNLLKQGKDLRLVQVFAGHKYPSTTERYKQTQVEELKNEVMKYHPLQ
jgi:integrase/recombinase XerD